jgi:hypothetical protein
MRLGRLFGRRGGDGPSGADAPAAAAPSDAAAAAPEPEISPTRLDAALDRLREQIPAPAEERQQAPEG